jgi:hypothetical protein
MSSKKTGAELTPEERQELVGWTAGFLKLPVHARLAYQMSLALSGLEDTVVIGPSGVGKSTSVRRVIEDCRRAESERLLNDLDHSPIEIIYYEASVAKGMKTALVDMHQSVLGSGVSVGNKFRTPQTLRDQIVDELIRRNIRLVCVDEAQFINSANLDLLRQVPDAARYRGHAMSLVLVGTEKLRDSLVAIGQMGQRFSGEVKFERISRSAVAKHLPDFHPHVARMKASMTDPAWNRIESDFFLSANGTMRRLVRILENANQLALQLGTPVTEQVLRHAIKKLAEEG